MFGGAGVLPGQRGDDAVELGMHGRSVCLVEDGADLGGHVRLALLGTLVNRLRR
jgi:hypothetical protein